LIYIKLVLQACDSPVTV